jgi:hypothetical protein
MFARIATFEGVDVSRANEVTAAIKEHALPLIRDLSGWSGSLTLLDPDQRKVLAISFFETKEDIQAAEPTFEQLPSRLPDELRDIVAGTRRSIEVYDVRLEEGIVLHEHTTAAIH